MLKILYAANRLSKRSKRKILAADHQLNETDAVIQYTPRDYELLLDRRPDTAELVEEAAQHWLDPQHPTCQVASDALLELDVVSICKVKMVPGSASRLRGIDLGFRLLAEGHIPNMSEAESSYALAGVTVHVSYYVHA